MSDTRAAIRELRSLSEKRSQGALSEPEAARWLALRRQLGLPSEDVAAVSVSPGEAPSPALPAAETPAAASVVVEAARSVESVPAAEEAALPSAPAGAPEQGWSGPSLDRPAAAGGAWAGPSLDAPAWSEAAAERATDPGLDEPPPVPFDEAPAAPPPLAPPEAADFGGSPDERVPVAPAADFVSYAREGSEAIELPAENGTAQEFEPQSLAQLATATASATPHEVLASSEEVPWTAADVPAEVPPNSEEAPRGPDVTETAQEALGVYEGVLPEPPLALESQAALDAGAAAPTVFVSEGQAANEGVVPLAPLEPEPAGLEPLATDEGVLPEPPLELGAVALDSPSLEGATLLDVPLQPQPPLENAPPSSEAPRELLLASPPPPISTWAPGAVEPPVLAADDFARTGDPLGERGLDPWPEALAAEAPAEELVETVSDEDVVEELSTPTPLPPFPAATPPGSGGIRGFQFPRPPPGPVPTPPFPPDWQRTEPGLPSFTPAASPPAPVPAAAVAPATPAPRQMPRAPVTLPVPPPAPPRAPPSAPVTFSTPPPTPPLARPMPASANAPVTPRPAVPLAVSPSVARPPTPVPGRWETVPARPPPAPLPRTPVLTAAPSTQDEPLQPLLELVDEVEPPPPPAPARTAPTPSPATGTPAVFGPPMMLNPSFVEGDHRVVIHTLEGQVHRGTVHNLDLQEEALAVQQPDGRSVELPTRRLKAVFFVLSPGEKPLAGRGERVQVTFRDGRQVVGYSDDHATGEPGFFVIPSDARTNTARVYVFRGGVQSITTG